MAVGLMIKVLNRSVNMAELGGSGDAQGVTQEGGDLKNHFPREKLCRN